MIRRINGVLAVTLLFPVLLTSGCIYSSEKKNKVTELSQHLEDSKFNNWEVSKPEEQNMDSKVLQRLDEHVKEKLPHIRSVLIVRNGYIVFEKYYNGCDSNDLHQLWSAAKSYTSTLIGIAIEKGYIENLDKKMVDYFPEYINENIDTKTRNITIRHLITMTNGNALSDWTKWMLSDNLIKSAIELPLRFEPGERFYYDNLAPHVLSGIITKTSGISLMEFARENLFTPLGIKRVIWSSDSKGFTYGCGFLSLSTRDAAKLGQLYLNNGVWNKKQVISAEWVKKSTQIHSEGGPPHGAKYGYMWWITEDEGNYAYFAGGYGGQFIYVIPDLDIVIAITSNYKNHHEENRMIVSRYANSSVKEYSK